MYNWKRQKIKIYTNEKQFIAFIKTPKENLTGFVDEMRAGNVHVIALVRGTGHVAEGKSKVAKTRWTSLQHAKTRGHLTRQRQQLGRRAAGGHAAVARDTCRQEEHSSLTFHSLIYQRFLWSKL